MFETSKQMTYETFLKLDKSIRKYIITHNSIMCSPTKIKTYFLKTIKYESAQNITMHYRLYLKNRYSLNKLVLMIILYRYGEDELFENSVGEKQRVNDMKNVRRPILKYQIPALESFLKKY